MAAIGLLQLVAAPLGFAAVRMACASEGGLTVTERPSVASYLHSGYQWTEGVQTSDCGECIEQVARRLFAHVDFRVPVPSGNSVSFVQYRVMPDSDPHCLGRGASPDVAPGSCVAMFPIGTTSSERYEFRSEFLSTRRWLGVPIQERRRTLVDRSSHQTIATQKYFSYATPLERQGRFEPSYHCDRSAVDPRMERQFFLSVFSLLTKATNSG
jgi:hypothetical protein